MRVCLFCVVVLCSSFVFADGPKVKYQAEHLFFRDVGRFDHAIKLSGTGENRELQWEKIVEDFVDQFSTVDVEIVGAVSEVKWDDGIAVVSYCSRVPEKLSKAARVQSCFRFLRLSMSREDALEIKVGDKLDLRYRLLFLSERRRLYIDIPHMVYRVNLNRFTGSKSFLLSGLFAAQQIDGKIGSHVVQFKAKPEN